MKSVFNNYAPTLLTDEQMILIAQKVQSEVAVFTENEFCTTEHTALQKHIDHYNALSSRTNDLSIAQRTRKLDRKRRRYLSSIKRALHDEIEDAEDFPQTAARAEKIITVLENNPVLHNISYEEESVQLKKLFAELDKPDIAEEIQKMASIRTLYDRLKNVQQEFDELRAAKLDQKSNTPVGRVQVPLDGMIFHVDGVLSYLERRALAGDETIQAAVDNLLVFTNEVMTVARKRQTIASVE